MHGDESGAGSTSTLRGGVTEARVVAAEVCADLRAGDLLDVSFERRAEPLDARDRRWAQELLFGMLRRRAWIDSIVGERVRGGLARLDSDLADLLRLGTYQLLFMRSVPAYAAIAQTVELSKRRHGLGASKLANAVLRRVDRERESIPFPSAEFPAAAGAADAAEALALAYSHPRWLVARWLQRWGSEETARLLAMNNVEPPIVVRPYGIVREQLEATFESAGVQMEEVPLVADSIRLVGAAALADLGAFRQGLFFVQDPGATLVTQYASIAAGALVADVCAAPGGKSLELSRHARAVFTGDRSLARLKRLIANVRRVEARNIHALVADARESALTEMDAVLVDAPCTGTGTFRRHPDARWRLKVSDLAVMAALQRQILRGAAQAVRVGGLLIYSTCSLEPEENEEQVERFLAEHPEWMLEPPEAGAVPAEVLDGGLLRVLPQRHGTDGAFAARLRRRGA